MEPKDNFSAAHLIDLKDELVLPFIFFIKLYDDAVRYLLYFLDQFGLNVPNQLFLVGFDKQELFFCEDEEVSVLVFRPNALALEVVVVFESALPDLSQDFTHKQCIVLAENLDFLLLSIESSWISYALLVCICV